MKELQDFITKAERFLRSAEHPLALGDYDSCASRWYYAAFFMAEAALMKKGLTPSFPQSVIRLFGQHFIQTGIFPPALGHILSRAHDMRPAGDYEVGHAISREEAENLLPTVQQFVAEVRIYLEKEGESL